MIFSSHSFVLIFLPIVLLIYFFFLRNKKGKTQIFLLVSSIVFYCFFNFLNIFVLLASLLFNYILSFHTKKNLYLFLSIFGNLLLLAFFKYNIVFYGIFENIFNFNFERINFILPLAISFFTFQQIAYQCDINSKIISPKKNFIKYSLFITFFPQLIAGPIVRYKSISKDYNFDKNKNLIYFGIVLFCIGLAKKVLIADQILFYSDLLFENVYNSTFISPPTFIPSWCNTILYTFGLYFDFSGYSDMAVGLGMMFGVNLPFNFNSPYKARTIIDFWQRWHITLTNFVNSYVYFPLLKKFNLNKIAILLITFFCFILIGIWHGPKINFVYFGVLQGSMIILYRVYRNFADKLKIPKLNSFLSICLTFTLINISMIFFRAEDTETALIIINGLFGFNGMGFEQYYFERLGIFKYIYQFIGGHISFKETLYFYGMRNIYYVILISFIVFFMPNSIEILNFLKKKSSKKYFRYIGALAGFLLAISILGMVEVKEFIYFQF